MREEELRPEPEDNVEAILADYDKREEKLFKKEEKQKTKKKISRKLKKIILVVEIAVFVIATVRLAVVIAGQTRMLGAPKYLAVGKTRVTGKATEKCIGRMWQLRKAADNYYRANKKFPGSMDDLYDSGVFEGKMGCPVTGSEYVMEDRIGGKTFRCPNPEKHRVKELWCYVNGGVPVIERRK